MNVYRVTGDVAYGHLPVAGADDVMWAWRKAAGKPNAGDWQTPTMDLENTRNFLPVDCLYSACPPGRGLLLNRRARDALSPLLQRCGEFRSVTVSDYDYQWFNCTSQLDAADQNRIEGEHDPSPGVPPEMWMNITRWAFRSERLIGAPPLFSVPQSAVNLMSTDLLKEAVEAHDLVGFEFTLLWSSETGGVEQLGPGQFFGEAGRRYAEEKRRRWEAARARLGDAWPPPPRRRNWLPEQS